MGKLNPTSITGNEAPKPFVSDTSIETQKQKQVNQQRVVNNNGNNIQSTILHKKLSSVFQFYIFQQESLLDARIIQL